MIEEPLLNVKEAIDRYKHLLSPHPSFGTDIYADSFRSEGIVLIEDVSVDAKGEPIRFDCYALILRLKGRSKRNVSLFDYRIEPRSLQLINPGALFSFEDISQKTRSFVLLFDKKFIAEENLSKHLIEELIHFHKRYDENIQLDLKLYAQVLGIYEQINAEFRIRASSYIALIKSYLNQLLYLLKREKERLHSQNDPTKSEQLCTNFLSLVEEHFKRKKRVYEYANILGITPNYLSEIAQENLNGTALSFIHRRRLKESEYLLSNTKMAINQIALKLHFDSASQFGRFFKHHNGVSPKAFRMRQ